MSGEQFTKDREYLMSENERIKYALQEIEAKHQEVVSKYDREEALWAGKNQFLEQQRDQAKQDL
jgi:hypothetical protein